MEPLTCMDAAQQAVSQKSVKPSTVKEYLGTIRALGLEDVPVSQVTPAYATARLQTILNPGTRRKHTINLRATLGLKLPCPRPPKKIYDLPNTEDIHQALLESSYFMWGAVMLYAGLRVGEACANQTIKGDTLFVDRQRRADGTITTSKTSGPVIIPLWLAELYPHHDFSKSPNTVYVGIRRAGKRRGLQLNPHQLRHAYATNLVMSGMPAPLLQRQMRHHDVAVTLNYYFQMNESDIRQYLEQIKESIN